MNATHASARQGAPARRPAAKARGPMVARSSARSGRGVGCACGGQCPACAAHAETEANAAADRLTSGQRASPIHAAPGGSATDPPPLVSPGRPLEARHRTEFEQGLGAPLGDVRIHDGAEAHAAAASLRAHAYTSGRDVVFARGTHAPDTGPGRWLMAHELAHVIQQRAHGPSVQRAPADSDFGGRHVELNPGMKRNIYFEKGSATIHADEAKRIPAIVTATKPSIRVKGFRSRDEDPKAAGERAKAVADAIKAHDKSVSVVSQPEPTAFQDQYDYRRFRVAQPLKETPQTAKPLCPANASQIETSCPLPPTGKVDIPKAFTTAEGDVAKTLTKLRAYKANPNANKATEAKLLKFFKPGFGIDRLIGDYDKIKTQIGKVAKTDMGTGNTRPGYRCANKCSRECSDATAITNGDGGRCRVTICPSTWDGDKAEAISTLIHEVSHCTKGVGLPGGGTDDVIYEREKAIPFLAASEAVRSADLFSLFVHELIHGGPDTILPTVKDDVSKLNKAQKVVEEALARLAKWMQVSGDTMRSLFTETIESKRTGWGASWGEDTYKQVYKQFGKDFGLTRPGRKPREKDVHAVAAIADRITQLETLLDNNSVKAKEGLMFTLWSTSSKKSPGILPGLEVEVDSDIADMLGVKATIYELLDAVLTASPHVSKPLVPKYRALIDWIRKDEKIGP